MIHCQNCGQVNNLGSNFCRFCGTRMVIPQSQNPMSMPPPPPPPQHHQPPPASPNEFRAPRPYIWKTDEFQLNDLAEKKTRQINQVQPLSNLAPPPQFRQQQPPMRAPMPVPYYQQQQQQHQPLMSYGYRCPHCGTQNLPFYTKKIATAGWIVFAVLLVMFFPLFWVGFLIKEDVKICPVCNLRVGQF